MPFMHSAVTRRLFIASFSAVPFAASASEAGYHFAYDDVIGTSMDFVVWASRRQAAERARAAVFSELYRLVAILDTRAPDSEFSALERISGNTGSRDLVNVLAHYKYWARRTGGVLSIRPYGDGTPRNVDALGKAYIIERSAAAALATPGVVGVLLNIGGDIVARGRPCDIIVADPKAPYDNGEPIARFRLHNAAVATSGRYARGAHLVDPRTGRPASAGSSATVVAPDAVSANALATTLCLTDPGEGLRLVENIAGADALHIARDGVERRTSGFRSLERPMAAVAAPLSRWPAGYALTLSLTLTRGQDSGRGRRGFHRPFVAVWIEAPSGDLIRVLAFWVSEERFYDELSSFWSIAARSRYPLAATARATREPGNYQLMWDGLDEQRQPVPPGPYRIVVETNQERGSYGKQTGVIVCADAPSSLSLPATANFEPVVIQYGPKASRT